MRFVSQVVIRAPSAEVVCCLTSPFASPGEKLNESMMCDVGT